MKNATSEPHAKGAPERSRLVLGKNYSSNFRGVQGDKSDNYALKVLKSSGTPLLAPSPINKRSGPTDSPGIEPRGSCGYLPVQKVRVSATSQRDARSADFPRPPSVAERTNLFVGISDGLRNALVPLRSTFCQ